MLRRWWRGTISPSSHSTLTFKSDVKGYYTKFYRLFDTKIIWRLNQSVKSNLQFTRNIAKLFWITVIVLYVNRNTPFHRVKKSWNLNMKFVLFCHPKQTLLNSILNIRVLDKAISHVWHATNVNCLSFPGLSLTQPSLITTFSDHEWILCLFTCVIICEIFLVSKLFGFHKWRFFFV